MNRDGLDSVGRPVDDEVAVRLEGPAGGLGIREQQPVQVKKEADVEWPPVLGEEVVKGSTVAGELLFAAGAQLDGLVGDDGGRPATVLDDDALHGRRRGDARDPSSVGQLGEQVGHLVEVKALAALATVDVA